jgi:hypothetical protein
VRPAAHLRRDDLHETRLQDSGLAHRVSFGVLLRSGTAYPRRDPSLLPAPPLDK